LGKSTEKYQLKESIGGWGGAAVMRIRYTSVSPATAVSPPKGKRPWAFGPRALAGAAARAA
jgi:hypothetical protein